MYFHTCTKILSSKKTLPACLLHNRLAWNSCLMGKSALKVTYPARKSTYPGLSDRTFFRAMNFRRIHKVSVPSIPKKATPHILSQSKLSAPYLLSIHHRGHTHSKSHGGDLADVIIKKACISYNGVFCQGLHPCP